MMRVTIASVGFCLVILARQTSSLVLQNGDVETRHVIHRIFTTNGAPWGTWRQQEFCPNGTFAYGYQLKIEPDQGDGDDTSVNGLTLACRGESSQGAYISSAEGPWGYSFGSAYCSSDEYLVAFQMDVEPNQGFGDDTAVNDIRFVCRNYTGGNLTQLDAHPSNNHYGVWGPWSAPCPSNSAICGLSVKLESSQNAGFIHRDDTALNDVQFMCCDN